MKNKKIVNIVNIINIITMDIVINAHTSMNNNNITITNSITV